MENRLLAFTIWERAFKSRAKVFPGIPDFICHFHFLRDIGKDFLGPAYQELRLRLRYHAATRV